MASKPQKSPQSLENTQENGGESASHGHVVVHRDAAIHGNVATPLLVKALRVGELAQKTGKSVRALRLYEERGLLAPNKRSKSGYRLYHPEAITRVQWIIKLQHAGLSLPSIKNILGEWSQSESAPEAMTQLRTVYENKLQQTRATIKELKTLESEIEASLKYLETCESCDPKEAVEACSSCERHGCDKHPPLLVAGLHAC